jgi:hypothetical protein
MLYTTMISIGNLYAALHFNLIQPTGLDTWYFYPFGTRDHLIKHEFSRELQQKESRFVPHVLFHFDQEPIYPNANWNKYDQNRGLYWTQKACRIFANSEHSDVKNQVCKDRFALDWYFFYHGFAALDWFHDSAYFNQISPISKVFCSFNHLIQDLRSYRMGLTARLWDLDVIAHGDISFHGTRQDCEREINQDHTLLSDRDKQLISQYLISNQRLPMIVDTSTVDSNFSAHFCVHDLELWQRSMWHVVNETVFYDPKLHLTEKIFKPIVALRPFVLVAAAGNLAYLRSYGFQTFSQWIDESYDDEIDPSRRLDLIATEIGKLCAIPMSELQSMYKEMLPVLKYNKQHFFGKFQEIIVSELVDNFDRCVRVWNNGRVDGRELPVHPDLESVKRMLLR